MKTQQFARKINEKTAQFVGTKWIGWCKSIADRMSVEFVDMDNCIYTSGYRKYPLKYNADGNKIFISCLNQSLELKGNVLFTNDVPVFARAA